MSDTIHFRAVQPKRPWRVAKLGGGHRTFASVVKAGDFACAQAAASWHAKYWTITNTVTGEVFLAYADGNTEPVQ